MQSSIVLGIDWCIKIGEFAHTLSHLSTNHPLKTEPISLKCTCLIGQLQFTRAVMRTAKTESLQIMITILIQTHQPSVQTTAATTSFTEWRLVVDLR